MKKKQSNPYVDSKRFLKALAAFTQEAEAYVRHSEWLREEGLNLIGILARFERAGIAIPQETAEPLHIVRHK